MKNSEQLFLDCQASLEFLCRGISERSVGSEGNREATRFFENKVMSLGWNTEIQEFNAIDWMDGGASLNAGEDSFQVLVSPYSLGCDFEAPLVSISCADALEQADIAGNLLLLHGEIAKEQLMPKNFVFYNPEEHQRIIALLEKGKPGGLICATGRNASLAGGVYPFPLIEDGDFDIPSVYMTEEEGKKLLPHAGKIVHLKSSSQRVPGKGWNVVARKGHEPVGRYIITAHIDAKKGTPGALDNASGVATLLLVAELLEGYTGERLIEIVPFNGEDYYAVPGQMRYLEANMSRFNEIGLNINIDGAGYKEGFSAFSFYGLPDTMSSAIKTVISHFPGITEGSPWVQGDHSMFIQQGCPAIAVSSQWFTEHIDDQQLTHTARDDVDMVDCRKLVEIAYALKELVE